MTDFDYIHWSNKNKIFNLHLESVKDKEVGGYTYWLTGGDEWQKDPEQSAPGCSNQQRGDKHSRWHGQAVRPDGQEKISQGKNSQSHGVVSP